MKNNILKIVELPENLVYNIYAFGSRVYGNFNIESDYDFILITNQKVDKEYLSGNINISCYSSQEFESLIHQHSIEALECLYLDDRFKLMETLSFSFTLDKSMLRHSISGKTSNSWVKAKKKLMEGKDYDLRVARNSLFHSLRIIDFGVQISNVGKIENYSSANVYYEGIKSMSNWNEMYNAYKPVYNNLMTSFRKIAPK